MKKPIIVAIVALASLAIVVGGASAWLGSTVIERLAQQGHELEQAFPAFKIVHEQKTHGLFSSSYDATLQLGCVPTTVPTGIGAATNERSKPLQLVIHHVVQH